MSASIRVPRRPPPPAQIASHSVARPEPGTWRAGARIGFGRAIVALLLIAVLSTAGFVHVAWERTASRNIETAVAGLDAQGADAVRRELTAMLSVMAGATEIVRSILFQGAIAANDEVKREFLFLSLLREQPALSWIGFGFPDGRFFGVHATEAGTIEMVEIGAATAAESRPLRRDIYRPIPGDIMFLRRLHGESQYVTAGAAWYRAAADAPDAAWSVVDILPDGFEPAVVVARRVELHGRYQGVVMAAASLRNLSAALSALQMSGQGKAFVIGPDGVVLASSAAGERPMAARLRDYPRDDVLAIAVSDAIAVHGEGEFRTIVDSAAGPVFASSFALPFRDWRLFTAVPRSAFTGEIDRNTRNVLVAVAGLAALAMVSASLFASLLFARPLARLSAQLRRIERFALDDVRHVPSALTEIDALSRALKRMAGGLSAFARYMPQEVVRPLVDGGLEPEPGGALTEVTVMFADLPGFTELTERLGPAVEPYLTRFLTIAVEAVHAEGGTVDKFIGDAVMAIWNAPVVLPDHAERACRAACAIRAAMHALPPAGSGEVRVRIGINTGVALVGNIGSPERLSYTAIGDTVNLASRLVGVAKEHGVEIVVSGMTADAAAGRLDIRPLGAATVRGRTAPVAVHALR